MKITIFKAFLITTLILTLILETVFAMSGCKMDIETCGSLIAVAAIGVASGISLWIIAGEFADFIVKIIEKLGLVNHGLLANVSVC